jgi:hypothetical protein
MTGPATNAASLVTVWKTLGRATALVYLAALAGCALASGIILDLIAAHIKVQVVTRHAHMLSPFIKNTAAIVLLAVLAYAIITKYRSAHAPHK